MVRLVLVLSSAETNRVQCWGRGSRIVAADARSKRASNPLRTSFHFWHGRTYN
jgi:hypothetical protein